MKPHSALLRKRSDSRVHYEAEVPRTPHKTADSAVSETEAELEKLADLRDKGIITDEEFDQKKKQLLEQ